MKLRKSFTILAVLATLSISLTSCVAPQEEYPAKKIEFLVGYGAGSANDVVARAFGAAFEAETGATVLVVNRPGASGIIGSTEAMLAPTDGYNWYLAPIASFTSAPLLQDVEYSAENFRSIIGLAETPLAISVSADSPISDIDSIPKQAQGSVSYAMLGVGHASQVVIASILDQQGVAGRGVPFAGSTNVLQSTIAGETDLAVTDVATAIQREKSGDTRILAITGESRLESLPDVPTVGELGYPGTEFLGAQALAVPADVPEEIADRLEELAKEAVVSESYQQFLEANDYKLPDIPGSDWMEVYVPEETARLAEAYKKLGITS